MLRVTAPATNRSERAYVLDVILDRWLGLPYTLDPAASDEPDATIVRVEGQPGSVRIADGVLARDIDSLDELPAVEADLRVDSGTSSDFPVVEPRLPVLYGPVPDRAAVTALDGPAVPGTAARGAAAREAAAGGRDLRVGLDVFGTTFALLTGLEDRFLPERDQHGRVPLAPTLLARRGVNEEPVVDQLVELLWAALAMAWPGLRRRERTSTVRVTQDVDRLAKFGSRKAAHLALAVAAATRRGGPAEAATVAREGIRVKRGGISSDPYYSFDRFMGLAERHGLQASFFFIARYRDSDGTALSRYQMTDPGAVELIRQAAERGHEIGLHPGYESFLDQPALEADAASLRAAAADAGHPLDEIGGRHHYLRWDTERSPAAWHAAGLAHDSSLGWAEGVGFRTGTSKSFPLWDRAGRTPTEVEERPLVWMDVALLHLGLDYRSDAAAERVTSLRHQCLRHGGDYTVLMHNDEFASPGAAQLLELALGG